MTKRAEQAAPLPNRWRGWAVVTARGVVNYVQAGGDEADAWRISLGWPTEGEILDAKSGGTRAIPVWIVEDLTPPERKDEP